MLVFLWSDSYWRSISFTDFSRKFRLSACWAAVWEKHRILHCSNFHPEHPYSHAIVGLVLGGHWRNSCAGVARGPHSAHHDNAKFRCPECAPQSVLHQSHRRVDGCLSYLRLSGSLGVRLYKRGFSEKIQT